MDSLGSKTPKFVLLGAWVLVALSILSCMGRADYNLVIGFVLLFLRHFFQSQKKLTIKASIQVLFLSLIFDFIWVLVFSSSWSHGDDRSEYWNSLFWVHNLVYLNGILELIVKLALIFFYYLQFKSSQWRIQELLNLKYEKETEGNY